MYSHQRAKVTCMWKIIFVECRQVGGQRGSLGTLAQLPIFFPNTCQKMRGGKHVKVKKRRRQDILRFRADARKLILGSIGTPLDQVLRLTISYAGITYISWFPYNLNFWNKHRNDENFLFLKHEDMKRVSAFYIKACL